MATDKWFRKLFHAEIRRMWDEWLESVPPEERNDHWYRSDLCKRWSGFESDEGAKQVRRWISSGPTQDDLFGSGSVQFQAFCKHVGIDHGKVKSEPQSARREVFKRRLAGRLNQYQKKTGRSLKALSEHLGWSQIDYQWLRRIKSKGADHARTKKEMLEQLAHELETTVDYLFGETEAVEIPSWEVIIELGIKSFVRNQPEGSEFAEEEDVRRFLVSRR